MKRHGFTLVELLVVIAVVAIVIALTIPAVQKARAAAVRQQCANNLRQMTLACHAYHDSFKNFPPGGDMKYLASWMVYILPYLEQAAIYDNLWPLFQAGNYQSGGTLPANSSGLAVAIYACPADPRGLRTDTGDYWSYYRLGGSKPVFMTDYVGIAGIDVGAGVMWGCTVGGSSPWPPPQSVLGIFNNTAESYSQGAAGSTVAIPQIADGTSSTLMIGERPFITPAAGGSVLTPGWSQGTWEALTAYWGNCSPSFSPPMGYYIYSGNLARDTVSGVNNSTTVISAQNVTNAPCGTGPYLYGTGPNDVNNACSFNYVWSNHPGGSNFSLADGSVRFVTYGISSATLNAASTYAGSDQLGSDFLP